MDLQKQLEFKNEITDVDKRKNLISSIGKLIESAKKSTNFEDFKQKINEDKEGMFLYGFGAPKYTTLEYFLDVEVYDFLSALGIDISQQIHQVDM